MFDDPILHIKPFDPLTDGESLQVSQKISELTNKADLDNDIIKACFDVYNKGGYLLQYTGTDRKKFIDMFPFWLIKKLQLS